MQLEIKHTETFPMNFSNIFISSGFSRKIRGAKGLKLPSILEETRVLDKYFGTFVDCTCFS